MAHSAGLLESVAGHKLEDILVLIVVVEGHQLLVVLVEDGVVLLVIGVEL